MNASDRTPDPLYDDDRDSGMDALAQLIQKEIEALLAVLPDAVARQWSASPIPKPRDDVNGRTSGDRPADPTADVALDTRRLAVRATVERSRAALRDAAVTVRGARLAIERAVARYDGEPHP